MKNAGLLKKIIGKIVQTILGLTILCNSAHALTFTATASGNFNSITTWAGGLAPGTLLSADSVVIPSGYTVTLNLNETFNNAATLIINGTLSSGSNATALILAGGNLGGSGSIISDSLVLGLNFGFGFTGSISSRVITSLGVLQSTYANITATGYLYLNNGTFNVTSGTLTLSNNATIIMKGGSITMSGTGSVNLTNTYNVIYAGASVFAGMELTGTGLNNLTFNLSSSGTIDLLANATIQGTLTFSSGTVNLSTHDLTVGASGSINGGNPSSYAITSNGGSLIAYVAAGFSVVFPVGTTAHYAPLTVSATTSSVASDIAVTAKDSVYTQGTSGTNLSSTQSVVNATWFISSTAGSGLNLNLQMAWSANMELNSFNRNNAYISHYTNGSWDISNPTPATSVSNNMYAVSRSNITSLSPFTVADNNAQLNLGIKPVVTNNSTISVYPNPATNTLYFSTMAKPDHIAIYDMSGHLAKASAVNNNSISVSELPAGTYNINFYGADIQATQKFVKQ